MGVSAQQLQQLSRAEQQQQQPLISLLSSLLQQQSAMPPPPQPPLRLVPIAHSQTTGSFRLDTKQDQTPVGSLQVQQLLVRRGVLLESQYSSPTGRQQWQEVLHLMQGLQAVEDMHREIAERKVCNPRLSHGGAYSGPCLGSGGLPMELLMR